MTPLPLALLLPLPQRRYRDVFVMSCFTLARSLLGALCSSSGASLLLSGLILVSETGMRVSASLMALCLIQPGLSGAGSGSRWALYLAGGMALAAVILLPAWLVTHREASSVCCTPSSRSGGVFGVLLALCNLAWLVLCAVGLYRRGGQGGAAGDDGAGMPPGLEDQGQDSLSNRLAAAGKAGGAGSQGEDGPWPRGEGLEESLLGGEQEPQGESG